MNVLIADFDLFHVTGGGQTFYRSLMTTYPKIDFHYLVRAEPNNVARPPNAHGIPYREAYQARAPEKRVPDIEPPKYMYGDFYRASNIAASVAGRQFDVVDVPDYEQFGSLLLPALRHHGVSYKRVVLSMHGRISTSIRLNWGTEGSSVRELELREEMQYKAVDVRYGLSRSYLEEWRSIADIDAHYLDPLRFMGAPQPTLPPAATSPPSLNFVGRTEKRKGPDVFVEIVWWLPRSSFSTANVIGPESYDPTGMGSGLYLSLMASNRYNEINFRSSMTPAELRELFSSRAVTFVPSRYDSLNLVALESLFSGCPTVIGRGAGACRFLAESFPNVPIVTVDPHNPYASLPEICHLLRHYDEYREYLVNALKESEAKISGSDLHEIYTGDQRHDGALRDQLARWYTRLMRFQGSKSHSGARRPQWPATRSGRAVAPLVAHRFRRAASEVRSKKLRSAIGATAAASLFRDDPKLAEQALKSLRLPGRYAEIFHAPEKTDQQLAKKLQLCWQLASEFRIDRVRIWREIARLERVRGNDLVAATYDLRVMRLLGGDRFGNLVSVAQVLEAHGFGREAETVQAIYGPADERMERCGDLLNRAVRLNRHNPDRDYEFIDEQRKSPGYSVSIIVSVYESAAKLPRFLKALQNQTLIQAGAAELIVVESGSPGRDYRVFRECMQALDIPAVYARSLRRETIQAAWNRGIALSHAPYLSFLGVDETLLPECLEVLAAALDADPTLDWVQANSLVTKVDQRGSWLKDVMVYDRTGYRQDLAYLETCYLSWVGALYRRSIHDRFGYYDGTFGAAGDTEFKNRVLPFIKSTAVPRTLGVFWNYPDDRTTQSPRAEIEDVRAWYLHRTLAGARYAFADRCPEECEALFLDCLRYRKSYCQHLSTDVEYAVTLASLLREIAPDSPVVKDAGDVKEVLEAYRSLDRLRGISSLLVVSELKRVRRRITELGRRSLVVHDRVERPVYQIFNDNRHEQHSFVWRGSC